MSGHYREGGLSSGVGFHCIWHSVCKHTLGSWYIYELSKTLCEYGKVMFLDEIQKKVNERVVTNPAYVVHGQHVQQPCGKDLLRKKVFFFLE